MDPLNFRRVFDCLSLHGGTVVIDDFDRLALKVLGSLKDIDSLRSSLIAISEDGYIDEAERPAFQDILDSLEKISINAKALQLWAIKNIRLR